LIQGLQRSFLFNINILTPYQKNICNFSRKIKTFLKIRRKRGNQTWERGENNKTKRGGTPPLDKNDLERAGYRTFRAHRFAYTAPVALNPINGNNNPVNDSNAVFAAHLNTQAAAGAFLFIYFRFH
jgi:hypothetical protein